MNLTIGLSKTQDEFVRAGHDFVLFGGGLGSGKTYAGAAWTTIQIIKHPGVNGVITANSYKQLNRATLATLFKLWDEWGIPYRYLKNAGEIEVFDTKIYCVSMDNYDDLRGFEVGWAWSDECAFYKREAFDVLIGRIRDKRGSCQWKGTTTPNGYNWLYDEFVEKANADKKIIKSKTTENAANLADSYIKSLNNTYDSKLAQQELEGEFVNLTSGKVYYSFDRRTHVKEVSDNSIRHSMVHVGLDFNVHPLCGVFVYPVGNKLLVKSEMRLEDSNTFEASKEILKRYPTEALTVICDETGNRRKSSSSKVDGVYQTDHEILKRAGLHLTKFRNPAVKDRFNNLNRLFEQGRIIIDPSCQYLIKDLEQLVYDNKDEMLSHISDALGYAAWHFFPLKKPKRSGGVSYR